MRTPNMLPITNCNHKAELLGAEVIFASYGNVVLGEEAILLYHWTGVVGS